MSAAISISRVDTALFPSSSSIVVSNPVRVSRFTANANVNAANVAAVPNVSNVPSLSAITALLSSLESVVAQLPQLPKEKTHQQKTNNETTQNNKFTEYDPEHPQL